MGEPFDPNYLPVYRRTRAALPIQQHAKMTKDLAIQLKHNEQMNTAWQDYALNFIVSQETPRARTAKNAAGTLSSTFQCGIGVFNMGDIVRREYPFSVSSGGKVKSGSRLTLLMKIIMSNYCHIMLICEADKLEEFREHLAQCLFLVLP